MAEQPPQIDIRLLGPLEVIVDGAQRSVNGAVRRSVLVLLALHPGQVLDTRRLVELVWGGTAPATAVNTLRVHISQLRRTLGSSGLVEYVGAGYRLNLSPECVDGFRFEAQARTGREQLARGDVTAAVASLRSAIGQWRSSTLVDVVGERATDTAQRWQRLRQEALVDLAEAELEQAGTAADVAELAALAAERPFDERAWALLIKAQYWAGRQADALATYQRATTVLADELGLEPGPELRKLQRQILTQDPALDPPRPGRVVLPSFPTSFVGRGEQVKEVTELIPQHRLVTLTGLGGAGKTRLAVAAADAVADSFAHGVVFASLERVTDPKLVAEPLAEVLDAFAPTVAGVTAAIGDRAMLVVLDNCEHLVEAVADLIAEVLRACPAVRLLATSRIPISVTGECVCPVPPLGIPPPDDGTRDFAEVLEVESVALFLERARQARPTLTVTPADQRDLVDVARLLAGIPLGIELAAAQCTVLTVGDVADRLRTTAGGQRLSERDRPHRHHSMETALSGSLQLLPPAARTLLVRMTVFHEPAELAAVEQVCTDETVTESAVVDMLAALAQAAVVNVDLSADRATYRLLSPVRQAVATAAAQLGDAPVDLDDTAARHAAYFSALVQDAGPTVGGPAEPDALARIDAVLADVRAALEYTATNDPVQAVRMVEALGRYWFRRRLHAEGRRWAARALAADQVQSDPAARAGALHVAGSLAFDDGDREAAEELLTEALTMRRKLGDQRAIGQTLNNLAGVASDSGDHARAYRIWSEVLEIFTGIGDQLGVASIRTNLGIAAEKLGRLHDATTHLETALTAARASGNRGLEAAVLERLAVVAAAQGDHLRAKVRSRAVHEIYREVGTAEQRWRSRWHLAMRHRVLGEVNEAHRHLAAVAQGVLDNALFDAWWVIGLLQTAAALAAPQQPARAARLLGLAEAHRKRYGYDPGKATIDDLAAVSQSVRETLGEASWQEELAAGEVQSLTTVLVELAQNPGEH